MNLMVASFAQCHQVIFVILVEVLDVPLVIRFLLVLDMAYLREGAEAAELRGRVGKGEEGEGEMGLE